MSDNEETTTLEQRLLAEMKRQAIRDAANKAIDRLQRYVDPADGWDHREVPLEDSDRRRFDELIAKCSAYNSRVGSIAERIAKQEGDFAAADAYDLGVCGLPPLDRNNPVYRAVGDFLSAIPDSAASFDSDGGKEFPHPMGLMWRLFVEKTEKGTELSDTPREGDLDGYLTRMKAAADALCECIEAVRDLCLNENRSESPPRMVYQKMIYERLVLKGVVVSETTVGNRIKAWGWVATERGHSGAKHPRPLYHWTVERYQQVESEWGKDSKKWEREIFRPPVDPVE